MSRLFSYFLLLAFIAVNSCSGKSGDKVVSPVNKSEIINIETITTRADDKSKLLLRESNSFEFKDINPTQAFTIEIDESATFQTMDGFGYTLTGASAMLINNMNPVARTNLLKQIFSVENGVGINYIRISMGASDLDVKVFSYNDLPNGETDINQTKFSIEQDKINLIPVIKEILTINPNLKIMATPWSAPVWMKTINSAVGGSLKPEYYASYATYFVKYIQAMKAEGINITSITPQNEPLHGGNNPSMLMSANEQLSFIKNNLGPAFEKAGIQTKIIIYDHNADNISYAETILNDATANKYIDGSAFHLYAGDINALSSLHNKFPEKNLYFTEQWTSGSGSFGGDFNWNMKNVVIGASNNWCKTIMQWNLANDSNFGPHTEGGCTDCKGAVTINGSSFEKNVAFYNLAQISNMVSPGSKRIASSQISVVSNVAFIRPDGKKVLLVFNDSSSSVTIYLKLKSKALATPIPMTANTAITLLWQ